MKPKVRLVRKRLKESVHFSKGTSSQNWQDCKQSKKRKGTTTGGSKANQPND